MWGDPCPWWQVNNLSPQLEQVEQREHMLIEKCEQLATVRDQVLLERDQIVVERDILVEA